MWSLAALGREEHQTSNHRKEDFEAQTTKQQNYIKGREFTLKFQHDHKAYAFIITTYYVIYLLTAFSFDILCNLFVNCFLFYVIILKVRQTFQVRWWKRIPGQTDCVPSWQKI